MKIPKPETHKHRDLLFRLPRRGFIVSRRSKPATTSTGRACQLFSRKESKSRLTVTAGQRPTDTPLACIIIVVGVRSRARCTSSDVIHPSAAVRGRQTATLPAFTAIATPAADAGFGPRIPRGRRSQRPRGRYELSPNRTASSRSRR